MTTYETALRERLLAIAVGDAPGPLPPNDRVTELVAYAARVDDCADPELLWARVRAFLGEEHVAPIRNLAEAA